MGEFAKCLAYNIYSVRAWLVMVFAPVSVALFVTFMEQRREPNEVFMDREEYWKNFNDFYYGRKTSKLFSIFFFPNA